MLNSIVSIDLLISQNIMTLWEPTLNKLMLAITTIADPIPITVLTVLLFAFFLSKKRWQQSLLVALSMFSGLFIETFIKHIVQRERPINSLFEMNDYSFPSAHTVMSTIFFLLIIFLWKDQIKSKLLRTVFIQVNILLFLLIGFSRIYLNAHYLSDVLFGYILGGVIFAIVVEIWSKRFKH